MLRTLLAVLFYKSWCSTTKVVVFFSKSKNVPEELLNEREASMAILQLLLKFRPVSALDICVEKVRAVDTANDRE